MFQKMNVSWFIVCGSSVKLRKKRDALVKHSATPQTPYSDLCFIHCAEFLNQTIDE